MVLCGFGLLDGGGRGAGLETAAATWTQRVQVANNGGVWFQIPDLAWTLETETPKYWVLGPLGASGMA